MLYKGAIHSTVGRGLTVLLPKISEPTQWGDCRPITLSSTMLKLLAQLLLGRGGTQLQQGGRLQWSRTGRQGVELLAILRRVVRMAKDWGVPTWIVKLDIQKAFDSVSHVSMARLIAHKVGGMSTDPGGSTQTHAGLPWEARLWTSLLHARSIHIATGDHITYVEQTNGVRQGSPDSPVVFGALTAEALDKAVSQTAHMLGEARGPPPPEQGGAYMDDTYLWSHDKKHLQATLTALEAQLASHGLVINPKKTAIIHSEDTDGGTLTIGGAPVACLPYGSTITVLGSPLTFGEAIPNLVAEMQRRGRAAFRQHRDILCARTDIRGRLTAYNALVRNAALWGGGGGGGGGGGKHGRCTTRSSSKPTICRWTTSDRCFTSTADRGRTGQTGTQEACDKLGCNCTSTEQHDGAATYWNASGPSGATWSGAEMKSAL